MKKFPLKTLPFAVMAISAALAPSAEATEWGAGTQIVGGFDFAIASRAGREVLIAQWLTYDAYGRPLRLLGIGPVKGNGATMSFYAVSDSFVLASDEYLLPPPSTDEYLLPPPSKEYLLPPPSTDEYLLPPYWGEVSIEFTSCSAASIIAMTADGSGKLNTVLTAASAKSCVNPIDVIRAMPRDGRF
ncbi:MAG: hypothetical protein BWZ07_01149 [Alphaproteobacteria bacterium ADurb.BinA280]|nr:MAG: hypothetical protein BWZ07_01149 [Alphaproteobacteria bacterium ADurb.BinA280]